MKKYSYNDMKSKGFSSKPQMRYLLQMAKKFPEKYSWVYEVLRTHGVPSQEEALNTYWQAPYNVSPETPSYTYTGKKTSSQEISLKKTAVEKSSDDAIVDYYEDTLRILKAFNAKYPPEKEGEARDPDDIIIEYYQGALELLRSFNQDKNKKTADANIWDIEAKDTTTLIQQLESRHRVAYKELAKATKRPISLNEREMKKQQKEDLVRQIATELEEVKAKASRLHSKAVNFSAADYKERIDTIQELEKIANRTVDGLLFQWIINQASTNKLKKLVKTAYVDHVIRLFEGKTDKFSSIEDALSNFSERLGLSKLEMDGIKKEAMKKIAELNLQKLEQDGITDPKAIRYMSKSKGKHTEDSASPYVLNTEKGKEIEKKLKQKKEDMTPEFRQQDNQANEFGDYATSEGTSASSQVERLTRYAQEVGKIVNLQPSQENIPQLQEEMKGLGERDSQTYKAARTGYKFTKMNSDDYPAPGEPIKGTLFQFVFPKEKLMEILNKDLREQLNMEMPIKGWIQYLKSNPFQGSKALVSNLEVIERELYDDPKLIDISNTRQRVKQMGRLINWFPQSYRKQILTMIAQGRYKHLHRDISDRRGERIFSTGYRKSSFPVMQSFDSHTTIDIPHTERLAEILDKDLYNVEELKGILDAAGISYNEKPISRESSEIQVGDKTITIDHSSNAKYQPLIYKGKAPTNFAQKEKLLEKLHDHVTTAVKNDKPLVYAPQPDGTQKPMFMNDMNRGDFKYVDYTANSVDYIDEEGNSIRVDNPTGGLQTSYKGDFKGLQPSALRTQPSLAPKKDPSKVDVTKKRDDLQKMLENFKKRRQSSLKTAAANPLWIDNRGNTYSTESEMANAFASETMKEMEGEIIPPVVDMYLSQYGQDDQPQQQLDPQAEPDQPEELGESTELPLAAHTKVRSIIAQLKLLRGK